MGRVKVSAARISKGIIGFVSVNVVLSNRSFSLKKDYKRSGLSGQEEKTEMLEEKRKTVSGKIFS